MTKDKLGGLEEYKMPKKIKNAQDFTIRVKTNYWKEEMYVARRMMSLLSAPYKTPRYSGFNH